MTRKSLDLVSRMVKGLGYPFLPDRGAVMRGVESIETEISGVLVANLRTFRHRQVGDPLMAPGGISMEVSDDA